MFIMLRGFCAGWSPRSLQDVRLGDAERVVVLSERTPSFLKGHRDLTVYKGESMRRASLEID